MFLVVYISSKNSVIIGTVFPFTLNRYFPLITGVFVFLFVSVALSVMVFPGVPFIGVIFTSTSCLDMFIVEFMIFVLYL
jgi:hypothetical protein